MSEYQKIKTKAELNLINDDECIEGYRAGLKNSPAPGSDKSKSYWHGWRNGMVDAKHAVIDEAQILLAREIFGKNKGLH